MPTEVSGSSKWYERVYHHVWPDNIAAYLLLATAILVAAFNQLGISDDRTARTATLSVLSLFIVNLIRDRVDRQKLLLDIRSLNNHASAQSSDDFFSSHSGEEKILDTVRHSAKIYQETGSLIMEKCQDKIVRILEIGGSVKIMISIPRKIQTSSLAFRNANLIAASGIESRINQFHSQLETVIREAGADISRLELRYSPYDCGYTLLIADDQDANNAAGDGVALVRIAGFRVPYAKKLDWIVHNKESPKTFRQFSKEFDSLFRSSTKVILVSGEPKVGKTTIFKQNLLANMHTEDVYYVISEDIWSGEDRIGFSVRTSTSPDASKPFAKSTPERLAKGDGADRYDVDASIWDDIADEITAAVADGKILIIDEIGAMQLKSDKFASAIQAAIHNPQISLFATIPSDFKRNPVVDKISKNPRATHYALTRENSAHIAAELRKEVDDSLRLLKYLRQTD